MYTANPFTHQSPYLNMYTDSFHNQYMPIEKSQKYFPKSYLHSIPGMSNVSRAQNSGRQSSSPSELRTQSRMHVSGSASGSNLYRAMYDHTQSSLQPSLSKSVQMDHYLRSINPFQKRHLLSQENEYVHGQVMKSIYLNSKSHADGAQTNKKMNIHGNYDYEAQHQRDHEEFSQQSLLGEGMKRLQEKYGKMNHKGQLGNYSVHRWGDHYDAKLQDRDEKRQRQGEEDRQRINPLYEDMVESEIDEKEFKSFGMGKQKGQPKRQNHENNFRQQQMQYQDKFDKKRQSIANEGGSSKLSHSHHQQHNKKTDNENKKQSETHLTFIDSENNDDNASGTFKIPGSIINEINRTHRTSLVEPKKGTKGTKGQNGGKGDHCNINNSNINIHLSNSKYQNGQSSFRNSQHPEKLSVRGKDYRIIQI